MIKYSEKHIWTFWHHLVAEGVCKDIIQLLTNEALNMMWYRPKNTNIDRGRNSADLDKTTRLLVYIWCEWVSSFNIY